MTKRQKVLVLYLKFPSLEAEVISWATFDGTGKKLHMTGDSDEPPYPTGLDALLDGWRLFQASQAIPEHPGQEFRTSYLKHEFFFEKLGSSKIISDKYRKKIKLKQHEDNLEIDGELDLDNDDPSNITIILENKSSHYEGLGILENYEKKTENVKVILTPIN